MRGLAFALALLAAAGAAQADETHAAPAVGAKLTYRLFTTTKTPSRTFSVGNIFTYIVTKSDGTTAEGIIKPNAIILECRGGAGDLACKDAAASPGAHWDGNQLTVPIDSDSGDALAKQSAFKLNHFLGLLRKFPFPSSRDPKAYNLHDFGPEPAFILTNTLQCDDVAKLDALMPFGTAPQVTLACDMTYGRTVSRDGKLPEQTSHETLAIEINHTGNGWVTLPSGNWQVQKYAAKMMPREAGQPQSESETLFSTQLGIAVKSHVVGGNPSTQTNVETTTELISVSP